MNLQQVRPRAWLGGRRHENHRRAITFPGDDDAIRALRGDFERIEQAEHPEHARHA